MSLFLYLPSGYKQELSNKKQEPKPKPSVDMYCPKCASDNLLIKAAYAIECCNCNWKGTDADVLVKNPNPSNVYTPDNKKGN